MQTHTLETCPNCTSKMEGQFCFSCGQKDIGERIDSKVLMAGAFEAITEMDSKLWRSLRELTFNPGKVALNYIRGTRASYINPIKYFMAVFAVYFAVLVLSGALEAEIKEAVSIRGDVDDEATKSFMVRMGLALQSVMREFTNLIVFITMPLFAFFVRWQRWRSKRNYGETLAYTCFLSAHAHLFMLAFLLIEWSIGRFNDDMRAWILVIFLYFGHRGFYGLGWFKAIVSTFISLVLYMISAFIATSVFMALRMGQII
jgi:hypothetical protein